MIQGKLNLQSSSSRWAAVSLLPAIWFSLFFSSVSLLAQTPKLEASISEDEIFMGESVQLQLQLRGIETPSQPDLTSLEDQFDVQYETQQSANSSKVIIINGSVRQEVDYQHIYLYRLTPKKAGNLTIPSLVLTIDGKKLSSLPLSLKVREIEPQDIVLVETVSSQTKVYPTQSFTITLRILVKPFQDSKLDPLSPLRRQPPKIQVPWADTPDGLTASDAANWLTSKLARSGVGFSINNFSSRSNSLFDSSRVAVFDLYNGRETRNGLDGKPIEYFRYELEREFTATRPGTFSFGPAIVSGTFVTGSNRSGNIGDKVLAIAPKIEVNVSEIPSPRPPSFNGGIGRYNVVVSASPIKLKVGDPLTLSIDFSRSQEGGPLELISAPKLESVPDLLANFDLGDANPTGDVDGNSKKFTYSLRPKRSGVVVPPIPWSVFDPKTERFVEATSEPIDIEVSEASVLSNAEIVGSFAKPALPNIKANQDGIFQNITDLRQITDDRVTVIPYAIAAGSAWGIAVLGALGWSLVSRESAKPTKPAINKRASLAMLAAAKERYPQSAQEGLGLLRSTIMSSIATKTDRKATSMTANEAILILRGVGIEPLLISNVEELLHQIDAQSYGGNVKLDIDNGFKTVEELIRAIESVPNRKFQALVSEAKSFGALLMLLPLVFVSRAALAAQPVGFGERFQSAQKKFEDAKAPEDYAEAGRMFEAIQSNDFESGAIYFNAGNAYLKGEMYGRAILNFRKAQRTRNNDPYLEANLQFAIRSAPGSLPIAPSPWYKSLIFWSGWTNSAGKLTYGCIGLILSALLFFVSVVLSSASARWSCLVVGVVSFVLFLDGALTATESLQPERAVIVRETIARKGTGQTYAAAFDRPLKDGAEFVILNRTTGWLLGRFEGVGDGWIPIECAAE